MRKALWVVVALFAATMAMSAGHAASSACNGGTAAPAGGLSVKQTGPVGTPPAATTGSIAACSSGEVPVHGSLTVGGTLNGDKSTGFVDVDGDPGNTQPVGGSCSDGFMRVEMSSAGPAFYEAKDGNKTDTKPGQAGNQAAPKEDAPTFAQNIAHNCSGQ